MPSRKSPILLAAAAAVLAAIGPEGGDGPGLVPVRAAPSNYNYPPGFDLEDALDQYSVESTSLLKRSMLHAGFSVDATVEVHEYYLDFASQALAAERDRIEKIRDELLKARGEKKASSEASGTCSAGGDGECKEDEASNAAAEASAAEAEETEVAGTEEKKAIDDKLSPEFGHFLTPNLKPGQADILRWEDDGSVVQEYGARVGLPPHLVPTLKEYADGLGLLDVMTNMLYDDPLSPGGARWFSFQSPYQKEGPMRNFTWNVERPEKKWKSDMHWFNTADELSHEDALRALAKGGFDEVLKGIGEKFGLDTLHVDSFGFVAVTNCERGFVHTDWEDVDGKAFNFLVGIASPDDAGPELVVEADDRGKGEVYYGTNAGILVGDGTRHGTRECDHRAARGVRITASIYLADPTEDNLDILAGDTTSIFPPTGKGDGRQWIWEQRGRHWEKEDGGQGLVGDRGRSAFEVKDYAEGCTREDCADDTERGRNACLRTCRVFEHDDEYKPGIERRKILGY